MLLGIDSVRHAGYQGPVLKSQIIQFTKLRPSAYRTAKMENAAFTAA
jgi:hypothetical protein